MYMQSTNYTIDQLVEERDRYVIPYFQRGEVWNDAKKRLLLDSIFRGWPLPKFYLAHAVDGSNNLEIVDGQQRRRSILDFIGNELSLSPRTVADFGLPSGMFRELSPHTIRPILNYAVQVDEIFDPSEGELNEFFLRLQGGTLLTGTEKLNAMYSGLRDFCADLTEHDFFRSRVSFENTRLAFFNITYKAMAIAIQGLGANLRFGGIEELFETHGNFSPHSSVAQHIKATLNFLTKTFSPAAPELRNRTFVQSVITLASQIVATGHGEGHEAEFGIFVKRFRDELTRKGRLLRPDADADYIKFRDTTSANTVGAAWSRHEVLVKKMRQLHPGLARLLAESDGGKSWVPGAATEMQIDPDWAAREPASASHMTVRPAVFTLDEIHRNRERYVYAGWRRTEAWSAAKKRSSIDSIFRGWKLPKIYMADSLDGSETVQVVDGRQRLTAEMSFMDNGFTLSPATVVQFDLPGVWYRDLPPAVADSVRNFTVEADVMSGGTERELREFFLRHQGGVPLTGREKLNAIRSGLRNFCVDLAKHEFFQTRVMFTDTRYAFFDVALKVAAIELIGLKRRLRYEGTKDLFEEHKGFSADTLIAQRLVETLDFLVRAFPPKAPELKNRSIVQGIITLAARLVASGESEGREREFADFVAQFDTEFSRQRKLAWHSRDPGYLEFISTVSSADLSGRVRKRHRIFIEKMHDMQPQLAALFTIHENAGLPQPEEAEDHPGKIVKPSRAKTVQRTAERGKAAGRRTTAKPASAPPSGPAELILSGAQATPEPAAASLAPARDEILGGSAASKTSAQSMTISPLSSSVNKLMEHMATAWEEFGTINVKRRTIRNDLKRIAESAAQDPSALEERHLRILARYMQRNLSTVGVEMADTFWSFLEIQAANISDANSPIYPRLAEAVRLVAGIGEDGRYGEAAGIGRNQIARDFIRGKLCSKEGRLLGLHPEQLGHSLQQTVPVSRAENGETWTREPGSVQSDFDDAAVATSPNNGRPLAQREIPRTAEALALLGDEIIALHQRRFNTGNASSKRRTAHTLDIPDQQILPSIRAKLLQIQGACQLAIDEDRPETIQRALVGRLMDLSYPKGGSHRTKLATGQLAKEVLVTIQAILRANPDVGAGGKGYIFALRAHGIRDIVNDPEFMTAFLEECSEMAAKPPGRTEVAGRERSGDGAHLRQ